MQRRSIISICIFIASLCVPVIAEKGKEDFGCSLDDITDSYFCSSGPLEGREFLTKSELDDAIADYKAKKKQAETERAAEVLPPPPLPSAALEPHEPPEAPAKMEKPTTARLKVMSWNMKALAGEGSDYDRAAMVLGEADIVALQEIDLQEKGKGFINVIGNLIQAKLQQKICRAWIQGANGERQTYGFLWKESTIGYVDAEGAINESCGDNATTIRQDKKMRLASHATFYFKAQKKIFAFGTTFMDKKPTDPEKSMDELFKSLDEGKWPILLAGDMKMGAGNAAYNGARKRGFRSAINGKGTSWDNVWYRGAFLTEAAPVDLYRKFSDARREDIKKDFSGIFPVMAEFSLRAENPTDSVAMVAKSKPANASKKKAKSKSAKTAKGDS